MNEKPQPVRSPVLPFGAAREAEELRLVAEIVLGRALEGDPPAGFEKTKSSRAWGGHTAGRVWKLTGRAIGIAQEAYRDAVAQIQRLTIRKDADIEADAREAIEEKAQAEDAARKAGEAAAAEGDLARERVQELERQLSIRQNDQKLVAQERARIQALEQQLAAHADEQRLLAEERARTQKLEQQLAARADEQKLLAQERARTRELEQQLSMRQTDQKLPAPEASGSLEAARLVEQGRLLLDQGNITAARSMLKRAAESGSTLALFLLAETYDPAILSDWGIFSAWGVFGGGRRGNVTKARGLYAKAVAGGVHEARYRLSALGTTTPA